MKYESEIAVVNSLMLMNSVTGLLKDLLYRRVFINLLVNLSILK